MPKLFEKPGHVFRVTRTRSMIVKPTEDPSFELYADADSDTFWVQLTGTAMGPR